MSRAEVNALISESSHEIRHYIEKREASLKDFIVEQKKAADALSEAHRAAISIQLKNGGIKMAGLEHDMYGNGDPGVKIKVDRLTVESEEMAEERAADRAADRAYLRAWVLRFGTAFLATLGSIAVYFLTK